MTIVHLLEKNAREFPNDVALVEINPEQPETRRITWSEFELVEYTRDLDSTPAFAEGNIETEYEHRFASQGMPIYRLEAYLK